MMRKTLAVVLFGTSLLSASCKKLERAPSGARADYAEKVAIAQGSAAGMPVVAATPPTANDPTSGEGYKDWGKNPWVDATKDHLSTFAADVDTASYTIARRKLEEGALPP